ncbi:MAG: ROK family transcriptional regulator [Caldilineaceae bacterium]|nr:ROK family transcriptional regulator [Caldilineaceae bacterium]
MNATSPTGGSRHIRRMNQEAILQLVRSQGPVSRTHLARRLGLNPSTVNRLVEQMAQTGLVTVAGEGEPGKRGGRPAQLIVFNGDAATIACLDLSNDPWQGALVNLSGKILHTFSARPVPGDGEANQQVLAAFIDEMLALHKSQDSAPLRGIGVGAPSIVLWQSGTVVWAASLGWRDYPLKQWIEKRWGLPTFVENDVNLLALGESWLGVGRNSQNLVVLSVGTGIGAGLILGGRLYRGATEAAGEVGYLPPDRGALGKDHTGYGPLEAVAAAPGLVERATRRMTEQPASALGGKLPLHANDIYAAARAGDDLASALMAETADYLSLAVAGLATVLNPEMILLGGEMVHAADLLLDPLRARLSGLLPAMPRLEPVSLGDAGVLLGAAGLVLQNTSAEIAGMRAEVV